MTSCGRRVLQVAGQAPGTQSWRWTGLEAQGLTLGLGSTGGPEGALSGGRPGGCSEGSPLGPGRPVSHAGEQIPVPGPSAPGSRRGRPAWALPPSQPTPPWGPCWRHVSGTRRQQGSANCCRCRRGPPNAPQPTACQHRWHSVGGHRCGPGGGEAVPGSHPAQPGRPPGTRHCAHHPQDRGVLERVQGALGGWGVALALDGRRGGPRPPRQSKGAGRQGAISAQDARSLP